jgi:hypothetical protein
MNSNGISVVSEDLALECGRVPAAWTRPRDGAPRGTVILLHGLGAAKEVQAPEACTLARAGFEALALDAPYHGARRTPHLHEALATADVAAAHEIMIGLVREWIAEIPMVVTWLGDAGRGPIGIVGISMGAFTALGAAARDARLRAVVSILGSPDWSPRTGEPTARARRWMAEAPVHAPERFPPRALLLATAGRDVFVPAARARAFADSLRPRYADHPERLAYVEYAASDHFMLERDWADLWTRTVAWLERFLVE